MAGEPTSTFHWGQSTVTVAQGETVTVTSTSTYANLLSYSVGDTSIATATPNPEWTSWTIQGISPGTTTVSVTAENAPSPLTITVTGAGDDQNFLNERGLTHFWENIDNIKQDKLTAGTNITISANNTISASQPTVNNGQLTIQKNGTTVNTFTANASGNVTANITVPTTVAELSDASSYVTQNNLSQYVTAEDIASTSALTPPVQTNMIADGAVTNAKIDWSSTSRPIYYRGTDWARSWTFKYDEYYPQLIFVAWENSTAMFARIFHQIYKVFQNGGDTVTSSINKTNHTWTLSTSNTGVVNVLELRNTKTDG